MVETGFSTFNTTVDKTNRILHEIELSYGWPKERRQQSYTALKAVLHAVRDRLNVEESAQLAAQLPMLLRGVYYDGWEPSHVPMKMHADQFMQRIRQDFTYEVAGGTEVLIRTVVRALRKHVSDGEWSDVTSSMPRELRALLADSKPS
jgi:uncharacterized protein (DUF2267 family)